MAHELQIRLQPEQLEGLRSGGRLVIDVETPAPAEVTTAPISESTGFPVRDIPHTKRNNFREAGTCADCRHFNRRRGANVFRCRKATFRGDCYLMAALSRTCDLFISTRFSIPVARGAADSDSRKGSGIRLKSKRGKS